MSKSLRTDPRPRRAERRARTPAVRERRPRPGHVHPASAADVRRALALLGPASTYGVRAVELVPGRDAHGPLAFGRLAGPGEIWLFDVPASPWRLGRALNDADRLLLLGGGAEVDAGGVVRWPDGALRAFMLHHVLTHELAHHALQHERRAGGRRIVRTADHERRAALVADRLRALLPLP